MRRERRLRRAARATDGSRDDTWYVATRNNAAEGAEGTSRQDGRDSRPATTLEETDDVHLATTREGKKGRSAAIARRNCRSRGVSVTDDEPSETMGASSSSSSSAGCRRGGGGGASGLFATRPESFMRSNSLRANAM